MPRHIAFLVLLGVAVIFMATDFLRLRLNPFKDLFIIIFGSLLRKRELRSLTGATYLLLASLVAMFLYEKDVFIAAISFLVIGDTVAAIVGLVWGRVKFFRKSVEGTAAGLASCLLVALISAYLPDARLPLGIGIAGAVSASVVEALPIEVNDNVVVPILSGAVMQLLKLVLH